MTVSVSMNGKSYEGLTSDGMATHIAGAIQLMRRGIGTRNDCKLVVAHILRQYQNRLIADALEVPYTPDARQAEADGDEIELEHAIPVGCIMNVLFHHAAGDTLQELAAQVTTLLENNTILAYVTPEEHAKLNKQLQSSMPDGFDTYPWRDVWARYAFAGVPVPEGASSPECLEDFIARRGSSHLTCAEPGAGN